MKTRNASAKWKGTLKEGSGSIKLPYIGKEMAYSFSSRFEDGEGTNPEELIAAAHSGCFSQALALALKEEGYEANKIETTCKISLDKKEGGFAIVKSELITKVDVADIDDEEFQKIADDAKENCPVSKALSSSVKITLDATLHN